MENKRLKITIFKTSAISKVVYLASVANINLLNISL